MEKQVNIRKATLTKYIAWLEDIKNHVGQNYNPNMAAAKFGVSRNAIYYAKKFGLIGYSNHTITRIGYVHAEPIVARKLIEGIYKEKGYIKSNGKPDEATKAVTPINAENIAKEIAQKNELLYPEKDLKVVPVKPKTKRRKSQKKGFQIRIFGVTIFEKRVK